MTYNYDVGTIYIDGSREHYLSDACIDIGLSTIADWENKMHPNYINYKTSYEIIPLYHNGIAYPNGHSLCYALCGLRANVDIMPNLCVYKNGVPIGPQWTSEEYNAYMAARVKELSLSDGIAYNREIMGSVLDAITAQFNQWDVSRDVLTHTGYEELEHAVTDIKYHFMHLRDMMQTSEMVDLCNMAYHVPVNRSMYTKTIRTHWSLKE